MNKKLIFTTSVVVASFLSFLSASFAWFMIEYDVDMSGGKGYTAASYFYSGDGSSDDPYVINDPIHMYNLAWLQYLGEFNKTNDQGEYQQYHFVLGDDVDMTGLVLPPIGTTDQPFVGTFDGQGYSISNLVVSNAIGSGTNQITKKPLKVDSDSFAGVNIVGMFGVVGNYNNSSAYSSFTPELKDFYLTGATINSESTTALVGLAAGYVDAEMSGVGVDDSSLNITPGTAAFNTSLTTKISDYTLVGYCTEKCKNKITVVDSSIMTPTRDTGTYVFEGDGGQQNGWGGSVDMKSLHARLLALRGNTNQTYRREQITRHYDDQAQPNVSYTNLNNTRSFSNPQKGQAYFATNSTQYLYLISGRKDIDEYYDSVYTNITGYMLSYVQDGTTYYLTNNGTTGITGTTNAEDAGVFVFGNANGTGNIRIYDRGTYYNLYCANGGGDISLSTRNSRDYSYTNNRISYTRTVWNNTYTYYLKYVNDQFTFEENTTNALTLTRTNYTKRMHTGNYQIDNSRTTTVYNNDTATYIPLNVEDGSYNVADNNTGYIMSGCYNNDTDTGQEYGDVRVSYYAKNSNLAASRITGDDAAYDILTRTASSNGFKRVLDSYNTGKADATNLRTYTRQSIDDLGLKKYEDSRKSLHEMLDGQSNVYGLHFMNASINKNNLVTAANAHINGQDYANYQMPADSIDFNLKEKGIVNFFAGSYYYYRAPSNFFSLHQIFRDSDKNITDIKEIKKVFDGTTKNHSCVYQYTDGSYSQAYSFDNKGNHTDLVYSGNYPSDYKEVFDTDWITRPTIVRNALYYYEIAMNDGEFAIGAANTGTGAYLLYLDIAANAQYVTSTIIREQYRVVTKSYICPYGIALVNPNGAVDDNNSVVAIAVAPSFNGTLSLAASDASCSYDCSSDTGITIGYVSEGVSLRKEGESVDSTATPDEFRDETTTKTTIIDINTTTLNQTTTEKVQTTLDTGSGATTTSSVTVSRADNEGNESELEQINVDYFTNRYAELVFEDLEDVLVSFKANYLSPTMVTLSVDLLLNDVIDEADENPYKEIDHCEVTFEFAAGEGPVNVSIIDIGDAYKVFINGTEVAYVEIPDQTIIIQNVLPEEPETPTI